jgi:6-pyruvoyltetrahydropterin/6-carboxytetrahydropterin synthase
VTLSGIPVNDSQNPKNGMVIDFTDLKNIIKREVINVFDHSVTVSGNYDKGKLDMFKTMFGNTNIVNYQPTCENLVADFAARIRKHLPGKIKLFSLKLYETATSYAEWYASDNE